MSYQNSLFDLVFQQRLLEGVSRSFAFTIPELPETLRTVVTNAYLLFRVADTIEDDNILTIEQKQFFWEELITAVSGLGTPEKLANDLLHLLSEATSTAEKELIKNLSHVIRIARSFNEFEYKALKRSIRLMCEGMRWFQNIRSPHGLRSFKELNDYCYYVAGVVGEFLTDLFCNYSVEISRKRMTLKRFAASFGQGLQMTNILKDLWRDLDRGVCWLPRDIFKKNGFDLKDLPHKYNCDSFKKGLSELIAISYDHLKNGLIYTLLIPKRETGIRKFCLWAIGLAIFTLRKIYRRVIYKSVEEIKISRKSVKRIILVTQLTIRSNLLLNLLFYLSAIGLPKSHLNHF